jgi:hypothetical protein
VRLSSVILGNRFQVLAQINKKRGAQGNLCSKARRREGYAARNNSTCFCVFLFLARSQFVSMMFWKFQPVNSFIDRISMEGIVIEGGTN